MNLVVLLGALLQIRQYLANRSFWIDEAHLAAVILRPDFWRSLFEGAYWQTAPVGFAVTHALIARLNSSEYALRALPLLSGLGSLFLFRRLMERLLVFPWSVLAVFLFSVCPLLVFYASDFHPYSLDLFASLLIFTFALELFDVEQKESPKYWKAIGASGFFLLWFSHAVTFPLAAIGLLAIFLAAKNRDRRALIVYLAWSLAWALTFAFIYQFISKKIANLESLQLEFYNQFTLQEGRPRLHALVRAFRAFDQATFHITVPASLALLLVGAKNIWKTRPRFLSLVLLTSLLVVIANFLGKYPLVFRLLLFLVPFYFWIMVEGLSEIFSFVARFHRGVAIALISIFVLPCLFHSYRSLRQVARVEEFRQVLDRVREKANREDHVYVYYGALDAFEYYDGRKSLRLHSELGIKSKEHLKEYDADLQSKLPKKGRVWVLFSHIRSQGDGSRKSEEAYFLNVLNSLGTRKDHIQEIGASAHLYEIGR